MRIRRSELDRFLEQGETAERESDEENRRSGEALLSRAEIAHHFGRTSRWVDAKVKEGMPVVEPTRGFPRRRFRLADVEEWVRHRPATANDDDQLDDLPIQPVQPLANVFSDALGAAARADAIELASSPRALAVVADRLADALEQQSSTQRT